ncbi:DUF262 domain-containing protein [Aeromicrobium sp. 50.2.37]|uniref:GmrSD restriction endonuclease domain-containing protein n=1 Tax=Aeromicrobium sp. 50.2.37 TaxID=2969305 RepID=UPI00214FBF36|nr:DUF262 domain-containing protein [Aeromicrobium sp. 50.2.37]MCR4511754.1 DUF262 domain-containing protein [Aeromicrobium sp. 50.2.37]
MSKYVVNQHPVSYLLAQVQAGQIAIPELQRPFVWNSTKVRDLLDSLYNGYPVGYLITWQSVGAALKDGSKASFQQILIDGQQRVTALRAALVGEPVVTKDYKASRIVIAFNPVTSEFATLTPVIRKNSEWISDVSKLFGDAMLLTFIRDYLDRNPGVDPRTVETNLQRLVDIRNAPIGIIALSADLDVETVSEIFIRINSKGVPLNAADFAMSKIATYGDRGRNLRKLIDYFCHLSVAPHVYTDIKDNDPEFASSGLLEKIAWLRKDSEDLYDPTFKDVIRVATIAGFRRGKPSSLVAALSGRDTETRTFDESRIDPAYDRLEEVLGRMVNEHTFKQFVMTIKSAGFVNAGMINAQNALNFAYALYLILRKDEGESDATTKNVVRRWFVMSLLTNRHSGSFESQFDQDLRRIREVGAADYLKQVEASELSESFWTVTLPTNLNTSSTASPYFQVFLASQVSANARGFLSRSIRVGTMLETMGDIHHILPRDYLRKSGWPDRSDYNQVANFALTETPINIRIGNRPPAEYMAEVAAQMEAATPTLGEIRSADDLAANLRENALPTDFARFTSATYPSFLEERRALMADAIRRYYERL